MHGNSEREIMGTGQKLKITENIAIQGLTMCKQKKNNKTLFLQRKIFQVGVICLIFSVALSGLNSPGRRVSRGTFRSGRVK